MHCLEPGQPCTKSPGKWRLTLEFVRLNAATGGLEGWPISNIQQTLSRLGTMKPTVFGLLDFTAGYHQTPLDPALRHFTAFMVMGGGGLYQCHGIERSWPLLSTQHVEHSPRGARLSNLRAVHRRCIDPRAEGIWKTPWVQCHCQPS